MYSLTWTEKDFSCSAIYDTDCCTQHKLVFDNYLNAAVKFLELFLDADNLDSFSGRICRVRLYKSGEGDLGKKVRRDKEAVGTYLTSKPGAKPTDINEEAIQRLLWRLDPDRPREIIQTPYYTWYI